MANDYQNRFYRGLLFSIALYKIVDILYENYISNIYLNFTLLDIEN